MRQLSPIQAFQNWLLDYEPAVGVVDYSNNPAKSLIQLNRKICNVVKQRLGCKSDHIFRSCFQCLSCKSSRAHISTRYTVWKVNWWFTDKYLCSVVEICFRGQALLFFPITLQNPLHRPYPRSLAGTDEVWKGFMKDIERDVPKRLANYSLLRKFMQERSTPIPEQIIDLLYECNPSPGNRAI